VPLQQSSVAVPDKQSILHDSASSLGRNKKPTCQHLNQANKGRAGNCPPFSFLIPSPDPAKFYRATFPKFSARRFSAYCRAGNIPLLLFSVLKELLTKEPPHPALIRKNQIDAICRFE